MGELPGLHQQLYREHGDGLPTGGSGALEGGIASATPGGELCGEGRKKLPV